jgi:hypothetical protein
VKKILVILLLLVYGFSSTGMTLHFHYCCGKLDKVDFAAPARKHCAGEENKKMGSKPCCENKELNLKITTTQNSGKVLYPSFTSIAIYPVQSYIFLPASVIPKKIISGFFGSPPLSTDLNCLYCSYRI